MLINRILRSYGFIFPKSLDPKFIEYLINMDNIPIAKCKIMGVVWYTTIIDQYYRCKIDIKPCTTTDIKNILYMLKLYQQKGNCLSYVIIAYFLNNYNFIMPKLNARK